jgi:hypothetical protein
MDVDAIPLGADFVEVLAEQVAKCHALLAIIGPGWIDARDERGRKRLRKLDDFVRIEIAAALKRNIPVIPVLLEGTRVPKADQLPDEIKGLAQRNALDVRHASFHSDMNKLVQVLKGLLAGQPAPAVTPGIPEPKSRKSPMREVKHQYTGWASDMRLTEAAIASEGKPTSYDFKVKNDFQRLELREYKFTDVEITFSKQAVTMTGTCTVIEPDKKTRTYNVIGKGEYIFGDSNRGELFFVVTSVDKTFHWKALYVFKYGTPQRLSGYWLSDDQMTPGRFHGGVIVWDAVH